MNVRDESRGCQVDYTDTHLNYAGVSLHIENTQQNFSRFIKLALKVLPEEIKLKRLGKEIKSTSRKVNFLEKYVLPILFNQIKYIQETIEEREHEDIFRLKRVKNALLKSLKFFE